jgi:hypothetical protein
MDWMGRERGPWWRSCSVLVAGGLVNIDCNRVFISKSTRVCRIGRWFIPETCMLPVQCNATRCFAPGFRRDTACCPALYLHNRRPNHPRTCWRRARRYCERRGIRDTYNAASSNYSTTAYNAMHTSACLKRCSHSSSRQSNERRRGPKSPVADAIRNGLNATWCSRIHAKTAGHGTLSVNRWCRVVDGTAGLPQNYTTKLPKRRPPPRNPLLHPPFR